MEKYVLPNKRSFLIQWLILGMTLLLLGIAMGYFLARQHGFIETRERERLSDLAKVIDANLEHQLDATNRALEGIRFTLRYWPTNRHEKSRIYQLLRAMSDAMPGVHTINILNAAGSIVASNRDELVGRKFTEREYFKAPGQHPDPATLYISPPFKTVLGAFDMDLMRVVTGPNGEFAGIVTATLDPEYFTVLLKSVLYATDMRASVIHGDGRVFLIVPDRNDIEAMNLARRDSFYTRHMESKVTASLFTGPDAAGDARIIAVRTVKSSRFIADKPLIVTVSRDLTAIFAAWRRDVFVQGLLFGFLAVASVVGLYIYQRREQKFSRMETGYVARLQESEEKHRSLFDHSQDAILLTAQDGSILDANQAACEMIGRSLDELKNVGRDALVDVTDPHVHAVLNEAAGTDRGSAEITMLRANGEKFPVEITSAIFTDSNGLQITSMIIRDITRRRLAEAVLRKVHDDLELRVQERTAELQQAYGQLEMETREREQVELQLRRTQKLEALGTLAGGIAHDFNNVLAGIMGFTEMVLEDTDPASRQHRRLELALKGAYRGRDLVKGILAFSRQGEQDRKPLALARIAKEALNMLRPVLPSTIEIVWKNPAGDDQILADPAQMHQVLTNLCTNAAHAMREKGGVLEIGISGAVVAEGSPPPVPEMTPGDYVVLEVSDTGCGMEPETLERIFDPFFTTKREGEGTGLGLSVSYGIVKGHDGYVTVESEPGKGSTFRVYLPHLREAAATQREQAPSLVGGNERILIVDDEDILVELNEQRLSGLGYDVVATTSSMDALHIFREEPDSFGLVIADQTMPNLTGMDLAAELLKVRPGIPIILCTGHNNDVSPERLQDAGIQCLLVKPVDKREMAEAIRRVLDADKKS